MCVARPCLLLPFLSTAQQNNTQNLPHKQCISRTLVKADLARALPGLPSGASPTGRACVVDFWTLATSKTHNNKNRLLFILSSLTTSRHQKSTEKTSDVVYTYTHTWHPQKTTPPGAASHRSNVLPHPTPRTRAEVPCAGCNGLLGSGKSYSQKVSTFNTHSRRSPSCSLDLSKHTPPTLKST